MTSLLFLLLVGCTPPADDDDSAVSNDDDSADEHADDDDAPPQPACFPDLSAACADEVVDAPGATGEQFGDATRATNGVRGRGAQAGSFDVYSLDFADRTHVTLRWSDRVVVDRPGPDLAVFENPFEVTGPDDLFLDGVVVEVSVDGVDWIAFPHDYTAPDESVWSGDPAHWPGFAGATPVALHAEDNPVDPFGPDAGGDRFDFADLPDDGGVGTAVLDQGARFVRLTSAAILENPDSGLDYPAHATSNGADIDGVFAAELVADPAR